MKPITTKRGFTLAEILITTVILAVIAGLAIPAYSNTVEQSRVNEAITTINIIHMGQKIYKLNNGTYWNGGANAVPGGVGGINAMLNVDISPVYYDDIDFSNISGTTYTARVSRQGNVARFREYVWNEAGAPQLTQNQGF